MKRLLIALSIVILFAMFTDVAHAATPLTNVVHCHSDGIQTATMQGVTVLDTRYGTALVLQTESRQTVLVFTTSVKAIQAFKRHSTDVFTVRLVVSDHNAYCTYTESNLVSFNWQP